LSNGGAKTRFMGSHWFRNNSRGKSVQDAYNTAVENANDEYGHQEGYSGEINNSGGFRDITNEWKSSKKTLEAFIDVQQDKLTKFDGARAICIQEPIANKNVTKSQVEHIVTPGTKKWVLKYVVSKSWDYSVVIGSYLTKGDAVKAARAHTEKTQENTSIDMVKVLEKGSPKVAKITYKKSNTERDGVWVFFGWASC
jgi:hypothetical protein